MITRRTMFFTAAGLGGIAVGAIPMIGGSRLRAADDTAPKTEDKHAMHMQTFGKSISECAVVCASCSDHCASLAGGGAKEHMRSQKICADCADICTATAQVVARHGLLSAIIADACARACEMCALECEKFPNDAHMKACAKSCRDCLQTCHNLMAHVRSEAS